MKAGNPSVKGCVAAFFLIVFSASFAHAAGTQVLRGHIPAGARNLPPVGRLAATNNLNLAIGLPLRNQDALSNLLQQIYDPASPNFHHFLTPEQFTERFGPTEKDYQTVIAFAKANGMRVTATHPNRVLLDVSGPVASVERALNVTMRTYRHPTENRNFFAPDTEPSLNLAVPILHIGGLDNYSLPRPRFAAKPLVNGQNESQNSGSGPSGTYRGNDFRAAYAPGSSLTGSGQVVGLLQFDGYTAGDITYYESHAGLPNVTLQNVLLDSFSGNPSGSGGEVEVTLDIEMVIAMAPGLSKVIVYEAPNPSSFEDILNRMVTDDLASQLSCSWYLSGGTADTNADQIFQEMAAQGQSFFSASGDNDAYTGLIDFPGDSPYVTQVGGTTLTMSGTGGAWVSEKVWNSGGLGSGGGISTQYPIPAWQTNISMAANQGSTTQRNTPDVALTADNIYVRADGGDYTVVGTSCAAPLWAGFAALVNQQAVANGEPSIGFINPAIDAIASGTNYTSIFHDITTGNNENSASPAKFSAVAGYDLCTGWGTPAGQNLINALASPEFLVITPAAGFTAAGGAGGPFTVTSQNFSITNTGTNSLSWILASTSAWLTASSAGGTLAPGDPAAMVTVSLNFAASNLVVGTYSATVWFTNLNDNSGQGRQFSLSVVRLPVITSQPTNQAVLEGATAAFNVGATGGLPLSYQWQDNGTNLNDGGNISGSTTTNLFVRSVSAANVGTYTVVVTNIAGSASSSNALLTITPSAPVIVTQPTNQTVLIGGTASFTVAALGTTPLSYQWSFNTTNILGATNTALTLNNVQLTKAGNYSVTVTNAYGSTNSAVAVLAVNPLPSCTSPPSGLVAWWQGEGNALDVVGNNNGTAVGGIAYTNGEVGQAFNFNGGESVVIADSPSLDPTNALTIEYWVYPLARPAFNWTQDVFGKDNYCIGQRQYKLEIGDSPSQSGAGDFRAAIGVPGGFISLDGATVVQSNIWYHIAETYDGATLKLYVNGNLDGQVAVTGPIVSTTEPVRLGGDTPGCGSQYFFYGMLDEPSIYNRALSSNEIAAIYNAGGAGKCFTPSAPVITTQPQSQTNVVGGTVNFSVTASGTAPLSYQWSFNTTNILAATNTALTLNNVQLTKAGNYSVTVTNAYGSTNSAVAVLAVNPLPSCTSPPSGLVAWWQGEGNALDVVGNNNGTAVGGIAYTNGEVGQAFVFNHSSSYITLPASPGLNIGTNGGFTIEGWIKPDAYTVGDPGAPIIEWDSATTDGLELWCYMGSLFVNFNDAGGHNLQSASGIFSTSNFQHIALTYDKSSGLATLYLNGAVIATNNVGSITPQTTYPVNIGRRTGQPYYLNATYGGLMDELSVYSRALSSNEIAAIYNAGASGKCPLPPTILVQPTNISVAVGATATFTVTASGTPPLSYQWSFNMTNILGATNTSLTLTNVQPAQAGIYFVQVSNVAGMTTSSNAVLTLNTPPFILLQPTNLTVIRSSNAVFNVTASGSQPLVYQWNFGGTNIDAATNFSLVLTNVQLNQAGSYAVLVTNAYGSIMSSNATLTVSPLFHFIWNQIPSPRFVNAPFAVVVQALDAASGVATNFTETVLLLSTNGLPVNPAVSANFIQGVWTGAVAVAQPVTNLVLQAVDNFGESGLANPVNVVNLPSLTTLPSGSTLYVFWPVNPSGFVLETTPTLSPPNWTPTAPPLPVGNQYLEPVTISGSNGFFRLRFTGQ